MELHWGEKHGIALGGGTSRVWISPHAPVSYKHLICAALQYILFRLLCLLIATETRVGGPTALLLIAV